MRRFLKTMASWPRGEEREKKSPSKKREFTPSNGKHRGKRHKWTGGVSKLLILGCESQGIGGTTWGGGGGPSSEKRSYKSEGEEGEGGDDEGSAELPKLFIKESESGSKKTDIMV